MADALEVFSNSVLRDLGPVVIVSPGSVETYLRCGGEIFSHLRIKNVIGNLLVISLRKSFHICQSCDSKLRVLFFYWNTI